MRGAFGDGAGVGQLKPVIHKNPVSGRRVQIPLKTQYGRLKVIGLKQIFDNVTSRNKLYAKVKCSCGVVKFVLLPSLKSGNTLSCGCMHKEILRFVTRRYNGPWSALNGIWHGMLRRCEDPNQRSYVYYGARGIKVCERWKDIKNFYADMGPRPPGMQLDRLDSDGDYRPGNVRWATTLQQGRNRRNCKTRLVQPGRLLIIGSCSILT